jgi:hypothetical protein
LALPRVYQAQNDLARSESLHNKAARICEKNDDSCMALYQAERLYLEAIERLELHREKSRAILTLAFDNLGRPPLEQGRRRPKCCSARRGDL